MIDRQRKYLLVLSVLAVIIAAWVPGLADTGIEPNLDLQLEQEFASLISKEVAKLEPNQRLTVSKKYTDTGDGAYRAYAILDTAGPESLKTERYSIEFRPDGGRSWRIEGKQLDDSVERLFRESSEAKQFFRFDSVNLEREGFKVTASNGTALTEPSETA